jgi:hypothetical protein
MVRELLGVSDIAGEILYLQGYMYVNKIFNCIYVEGDEHFYHISVNMM